MFLGWNHDSTVFWNVQPKKDKPHIFRAGVTIYQRVNNMKKDASNRLKSLYGFENPQALPISTDPFGSYTGVGEDATEKPVQDADDL